MLSPISTDDLEGARRECLRKMFKSVVAINVTVFLGLVVCIFSSDIGTISTKIFATLACCLPGIISIVGVKGLIDG